jgi:hypothetical protein
MREMAAMTSKYVIILDRSKPTEQQAVQEIVKVHAKGWWRRFEATWIVGGHDAKYWRALIQPIMAPGPSGVLVLRLADAPTDDRWAYYGPTSRFKSGWLQKNLPRSAPTAQLPSGSGTAPDGDADKR